MLTFYPFIRLIVLAVIEAYYTNLYLGSTNATLDQITPSCIMSVHLGWSLVSATVLCLKPFVVTLGSGYLMSNHNLGPTTGGTNGSGHLSSRQSRRLSMPSATKRVAAPAMGVPECYTLSHLNQARLKAVTDSSSADHDCAVSEIESTGDGVRRVSDDGSQDLFIRESETQERNSGAAEMSLRG